MEDICFSRRDSINCVEIISSGGLMIPGRSGHRIVCIDGDIYVIGGYVQLRTGLEMLSDVWAFNILAKTWRRLNLPNCPFQLALSVSALAVGKRILIHGGTGLPFAMAINNTIIEIDVVTEQCKEYACLPKNAEEKNMPEATYGHSLTYVCLGADTGNISSVDESMLIKVGGARNAPYTNIVSAFSFATGTWERLFGGEESSTHEIFKPRYRHDAIYWKDELYIIGGINSEGGLPFWPMPVFDVRKRKWRYVTFCGSCPPSMQYTCSVHFDNVVYTTGGVLDATAELNNFVFSFDLDSLIFYIVAMQPRPTFFHDLTIVPGRNEFYSFGGVRNKLRVNRLYRFGLVHRPCSLAELCWQQFSLLLRSFYPPNLTATCLYKELHAASEPLLGIPSSTDAIATSAGNMTSGSVQTLSAYIQSVFPHLSQLGYTQERQRPASTPTSVETFFNSIMDPFTAIVTLIKSDRHVDPVECVSIFLTVLFYNYGAPLQYVTRLPYGFRCLEVVSHYLSELSDHEDSAKSAKLLKKKGFAPA